MMHICVGKLIIIGSDNGLLPGRRQAIIWTSAGILRADSRFAPDQWEIVLFRNNVSLRLGTNLKSALKIGMLGTSFSEILFWIRTFSFKKMYLIISLVKWHPFCLGLNVVTKLLVVELCVFQFTYQIYRSIHFWHLSLQLGTQRLLMDVSCIPHNQM